MKFVVYTYDVWGNRKDGYEVNDVCASGIEINLRRTDNKSIINTLKKEDYIRKCLHVSSFSITGEDYHTLYIYYKDYPVCELKRID